MGEVARGEIGLLLAVVDAAHHRRVVALPGPGMDAELARVVGVRGEAAHVVRRRMVGGVRLHVMEVEEKGLAQLRQQPGGLLVEAAGVLVEALLVEALEAAREAADRIHLGGGGARDRARRHGGRGIAVRAQDLRQRAHRRRDPHAGGGREQEDRRLARGQQRVGGGKVQPAGLRAAVNTTAWRAKASRLGLVARR